MTREEAIKRLKDGAPFSELLNAEWEKAINMAIEALKQQSCEDAISRQAVLDALDDHKYSNKFCEEHHIDWSINLGMARIAINDLPSTTPKEKTGKWIVKDSYIECSICGGLAPSTDVATGTIWKISNYCPDCGYHMINPQESEDEEC